MKLVRLLMAALFFSAALYVFLLDSENCTELPSSFGINLKHATVTILSIQGMLVGAIPAIKTILEERTARTPKQA